MCGGGRSISSSGKQQRRSVLDVVTGCFSRQVSHQGQGSAGRLFGKERRASDEL